MKKKLSMAGKALFRVSVPVESLFQWCSERPEIFILAQNDFAARLGATHRLGLFMGAPVTVEPLEDLPMLSKPLLVLGPCQASFTKLQGGKVELRNAEVFRARQFAAPVVRVAECKPGLELKAAFLWGEEAREAVIRGRMRTPF